MIVSIKNLNFAYDESNPTIKDLSLGIKKGSYNTIIGHNGSGKSTIAKLLLGLLEKQSGTIEIDGQELTDKTVYLIRDKIGIVFQNPDNQFIGSTVRDDIAFGLENHQVDPKDMDAIIMEFAGQVGMLDFLEHEPTKLSGGQKQRVAIAGVLAMHPDILILDEATSMLDPKGKKEVNDLVRSIYETEKTTIISITHDIEEVSGSDYVFVMSQGQLAMEGKPQDILLRKQELFDLSLDVPFSVKVSDAFKRQGIHFTQELDLEGMVRELWQLNSKQ